MNYSFEAMLTDNEEDYREAVREMLRRRREPNHIDFIGTRELILYVEGTRPFMDKCSEIARLASLEYIHWNTRLSWIREIVRDAVGQYEKDFGYRFEKSVIDRAINTIAKDLGVLRDIS